MVSMATAAMLTDRAVKLLYRQRGSALRKVEQGIVISPLKRPRPQEFDDDDGNYGIPASDEDLDEAAGSRGDSIEVDEAVSPVFPASGSGTPEHEQPTTATTATTTITPHREHRPHEPALPTHDQQDIHFAPLTVLRSPDLPEVTAYEPPDPAYDFSDVPVTRLSSSITSITSVDVLVALFQTLFEEQLIPQSYANFETATSREDKLIYKLDIKIFNTFLEKVLADLRDIMDINVSNNELCFQLKQIIKAKKDLTESLLQVRQNMHELKMKSEANTNVNILRQKLDLNAQLHSLEQELAQTPSLEQQQDQVAPLLGHELEEFIELMDPFDGVLARLKALNHRLEEVL